MATAIEAPASSTAEGPLQHTQIQAPSVPLTDEQKAALARLREPFPPEAIGYRPKVTCRKCASPEQGECPMHVSVSCPKCLEWVSESHICLAYVGHADITERLLEVDPAWDWKPLGHDEHGLPQFDRTGGLWIKLIVCGVTRNGYGDGDEGSSPKAVIGNAIRNAAMRFGMALELWRSKTDPADALRESGAPRPEFRLKQLQAKSRASWGKEEELVKVRMWAVREGLGEALVDIKGEIVEFQHVLTEQIDILHGRALVDFRARVLEVWSDPAALKMRLGEARTRRFLGDVVPAGPEEMPTRIEDLLTARLAELEATQDGDERSAA
ncbi:hypothetical protein ABZ404_39045 [Streptomyces sp. NPDC005878]|uniref:hypothetical protein n=1 Tax=Streptomyces sp. NPDC005878 TaxID=3157077 RepID=UPI003404B55F